MSLLHQLLTAFRRQGKEGEEEKEKHPDPADGDEEEGSQEAKRMESGGSGGVVGWMQSHPSSSPPRPLSPVARYSLSSHESSYQLDDTGVQGRNHRQGAGDEREEQAAWQQLQREPPQLTAMQPTSEYKQRSSEYTPLLHAPIATGGGRGGEPGFRITMEPVRSFHDALRQAHGEADEGDEAEDESDADSVASLVAVASTPALTAASAAAASFVRVTGLHHPKALQASEREHLARLEAAWHKQLHRQSHSSLLEWWRSDRGASSDGGVCSVLWRHKLLLVLVATIFIAVALLIYFTDPHSSHAEMRKAHRHRHNHRAWEEQMDPSPGSWPLIWDQTDPDTLRRRHKLTKEERAIYTQLTEIELNPDTVQPIASQIQTPPRRLPLRIQ